jgi:hypothetical protein
VAPGLGVDAGAGEAGASFAGVRATGIVAWGAVARVLPLPGPLVWLLAAAGRRGAWVVVAIVSIGGTLLKLVGMAVPAYVIGRLLDAPWACGALAVVAARPTAKQQAKRAAQDSVNTISPRLLMPADSALRVYQRREMLRIAFTTGT